MATALTKIDELLCSFDNCNKHQENIKSNNFPHHHSWNNINLKQSKVLDILKDLQCNGNDKVPIYDVSNEENDELNAQSIYDAFYNGCGAIIVRGAYTKQTMNAYNKWCESFLEIAKKDKNCRHPKQKGKYLINDVMTRLGRDDMDLLMKLINNKHFTHFCDILLGFMKFGSCTTHWIEAGGDRQLSHVDYPMHVGSGPFWEKNVHKLMQLTTVDQINNILPFYSIQVLIASDQMDVRNGSTELIPCSHRIQNIDVLIHDDSLYNELEPLFVNVSLKKGDFLIFNRRLVHRGGKNLSDTRRNSLIMQCVWLWGVGQEIIDFDEIWKFLKESKEFNRLSNEDKDKFLIRLKPPYPADIKIQT